MRIAVDAMGGDHAPDEIIAGVLEVLPQLEKDDSILLVGPQDLLEQKLAAMTYDKERLSIVDAPDVIGMDEKPIDSLRKKPRSSIGVLAKLAKTGPGRRRDLGGQHRARASRRSRCGCAPCPA